MTLHNFLDPLYNLKFKFTISYGGYRLQDLCIIHNHVTC